MAAASRETLQRIASDTSYQPGTIEKVLGLLDLLREIADDALLGERLALKGGTALNLFYLGLDRLSVDIDLNYVGGLARETMLAERPEIEAALQRILGAQGYRVRRLPDDHAGGKWIVNRPSALGGQGALEIDLNYMMRQPLFGATRRDSRPLGGVRASGVLTVDLHEIIGGKLAALLDRRAARDLFDARRIFELTDVNWRHVKAAMLAFGAAGRSDWRQRSVADIGANSTEMRQKLLICLPRGMFAEKGDIDAWIAETTAICRERVAPLLTLTEGEHTFLNGVLERGEIDTTLLGVEAEIQGRIAAMPMLHWKCAHIRKWKGKVGH